MKSKLKVLILAEAANPEWVSVPLIGWSMSRAIASECEIVMVTQVRNRDAFLRAGLAEGTDFFSIDTEGLVRPLRAMSAPFRTRSGTGWTMLALASSLSYPYFEHLAWKLLGARIRSGEFDIVHRVTPLTPTSQSSIARKCAAAGVPFVLGPLNGGVPWPKGFDSERRKEREWLSYVRGIYKLLPNRVSTVKYASAVLCGSRHTMSELPRRYADKYHYLPENGIDPSRFTARRDPSTGPIRVCFLGRLVPYKGPDMLLEAAEPLLRAGLLKLEIAGDGPLMPALREFVQTGGLAESVTLHGWVQHESVQQILASCAVMALPSVREFGGGVVLEAMAVGTVPLVIDYAGPGELVDAEVGFKIPLGSRAQICASLRECLSRIAAADPSALEKMSAAGVERVQSRFTWQAKARAVVAIYRDVLKSKEASPASADLE